MSQHLRVLISGYYGFGNAGDEAILAGLIEGFRQVAPQAHLTVLSADPPATERDHGVRAVPRGLRGLRAHLREADLFISGGGGLLQDVTSWRSPLYYLATLRLARSAGKPTACIGHGIGPLRRKWIRAAARRELSKVKMLSVRDYASLQPLRELGVDRSIEVTADLAFALPAPRPEQVAQAWDRCGLSSDGRPAAGVCLRRPPGRHGADLASSLARAIAPACEQLGLRMFLVPMQHPRDLAFADQVARALPSQAELVQTKLTARELLGLIGGFDVVVAMRLHALIFAALCGVAPVAISYDPKIEGMMAELGLRVATSVAAFDATALAKAVADAFGNRAPMADSVRARAASLRRAALRNIELAMSVLR